MQPMQQRKGQRNKNTSQNSKTERSSIKTERDNIEARSRQIYAAYVAAVPRLESELTTRDGPIIGIGIGIGIG